jgi:glycerate dehydrogenase
LLELANRIGLHAGAVAMGEWGASPDFCFTRAPLTELAGKTMGIIGFGAIGQRVGAIAHAMGMHVCVPQRGKPLPRVEYPVEACTLDAIARRSDVLSLHCPLTPENAGFIDAAFLSRMKRTAFLLNTARGGLVHEADLAAALNARRIAGYGADVLAVEPPVGGNPLLRARNAVFTPHIAWATREARLRCMQITADNIAAFLRGAPINRVA